MLRFLLFLAIQPFNILFLQDISSYVVLNNSRIYYYQQGSGNPAVIFVSGMAHDHRTWKKVQDSVSTFTTTISYDRAGLGSSEFHNVKKDLTSLANELNGLIQKLKIKEPFILVGHSMGCQVIKKYASLHPEKIKGIVLLDPGYNEKFLKADIPDTLWKERESMIKKYQPNFNKAQLAESASHTRINEEADKITVFPKVPIVFFTATMITEFPASKEEQKIKMERHMLWLKQMPQAKHVLINNS